jgi:hypothetical protein
VVWSRSCVVCRPRSPDVGVRCHDTVYHCVNKQVLPRVPCRLPTDEASPRATRRARRRDEARIADRGCSRVFPCEYMYIYYRIPYIPYHGIRYRRAATVDLSRVCTMLNVHVHIRRRGSG